MSTSVLSEKQSFGASGDAEQASIQIPEKCQNITTLISQDCNWNSGRPLY